MISFGHNDLAISIKDRAHLSTFKIFIFEKFSCFIVLVVFFGYCPIIRIDFCVILRKNDIFPIFFSYHIFAIYVGGASLGLPTSLFHVPNGFAYYVAWNIR